MGEGMDSPPPLYRRLCIIIEHEIKFSSKNFLSSDQIRSFLRLWLNLFFIY